MTQEINENELQAYVDGQLEPQRQADMERWLAEHPEHAGRTAAYRRQNEALHALFDPVLEEPVPARMQPAPRRPWLAAPLMRYAAVMAWVALGGMLGWALHGTQQRPAPGLALAHQAALAHVVYTPEVRHPVEVGADQEAHLVA
ncbi:MAG TPA: anti-sigma factor, partial [Gallionellaceae bacterium]